MTVFKRFFLAIFLALLLAAPVRAADDVDPLTPKDVFKYLDQSMAWYRDVTTRDSTQSHSREVLLCSALHASALKALRLSFDFARIEAEILEIQKEEAPKTPPETAAPADTKQPNMTQIKANVEAKIADIKARQTANEAELHHARAANRVTLQAKRDKIAMEMTLAQAQMDLIDTVMGLASEKQDNSLSAQINNLEASIPEFDKKKKADPIAAQAAATTTDDKTNFISPLIPVQLPATETKNDDPTPDVKGIIGLSSDVLAGMRRQQDLSDLLDQTKTMQGVNQDMLTRLRKELVAVVNRANTLGQEMNDAAAILDAQTKELDTLTSQFKQVGKGIVPLSEQRKVLESSAHTLNEWQKLFSEQIRENLGKLFFRLFGLAIAIIIPFALSEAVRRITLQYVRDARRRRQLSIIRRSIVAVLVGLIVLLNLVTEFGSLATFIGFVTAGVAVALQNVILSVVAYFFFFGRFGIKVGSRVTVYGTTGDVIETGLVRLYLMEMTEENDQYRPTGRVVAFPNSILFQPTAFFKQVPGVNYRWHEITFMLEAETDRMMAEQKLHEAVESIHADNRGMIEMQKAALEQSAHYTVKEPHPEGRLDARADGLAFTIRYPVDVEQAEQTDKNVTQQILDIFEREPNVKRINNNPPMIRQH
jgi:small-conductance mechanosensitive channel